MSNNAAIMKNEIQSIAKLRGLILSKRYITVSLGAAAFFLGALGLPVSPLYILLILNLIPPVLSYTLNNSASKSKLLQSIRNDKPFQLNNIKVKYKYSKINDIANSIAYSITIILICLWQINYKYTGSFHYILSRLPLLILATGLALRFITALLYRIKLPYDLLHNKV